MNFEREPIVQKIRGIIHAAEAHGKEVTFGMLLKELAYKVGIGEIAGAVMSLVTNNEIVVNGQTIKVIHRGDPRRGPTSG